MSSEQRIYRRVVRREMHSSRAGAAITVAMFLVVLLAAIGAGCVLLIAHLPAVSAVRGTFADASRSWPAIRYPVLAGGIIAIALGVGVALFGILPGRRARRRLDSGRCAIVIDDDVIANALADRVAWASDVPRDQVSVTVNRRRAVVRVVPTSGIAVDRGAVSTALSRDATVYGLSREARLVIAVDGAVR